ncbi:MAG TPA: hypothetical protein VFN57_16965 [Thermomicrobiaceae bacterium]|nr:hypothetical protein [Thermomicrobiaceae bacterium]
MTTVDILAAELERACADAATLVWRDYTLRVVAGRPGSVCFTLLQEIPPAVWIVQAEGFTFDGTIHYTQNVLGDVDAERAIRRIIDAQYQHVARHAGPAEPVATGDGDLAADA